MKLLYTLQRYDTRVFLRLANVRLLDPLQRIFRPISKTGDGPWYLLILLLIAWQQGGFSNRYVQVILMAFLIERPMYFLLKNSFKRNRPQAVLKNYKSFIVPHDQFSFPSGHTSAAFLMATLLSVYSPLLTGPLYLWAACVGFSRVLMGVHFPGDVMVGALMGIGIANVSLQLVVG